MLGAIGTGKSRSVRTLLREYPDETGKMHPGAGLTVLTVALEPGAEATNGDCTCEHGFHLHTHLPVSLDLDMMEEWTERLGILSMESIAKMEVSPTIRKSFNQFMGLYSICRAFICDRCGENFGAIDKLDDSFAIVNDGLSGLSDMAKQHLVGPKPIMSLPQFGAAQELVLGYLKLCLSIKASFVLVAHWSKEINQVTGDRIVTLDTIGNKLAPRIAKLFDEIIVTQRSGSKFSWSNNDTDIELKARRLPYSDNIEPTFVEILGQRGGNVLPLRQRK